MKRPILLLLLLANTAFGARYISGAPNLYFNDAQDNAAAVFNSTTQYLSISIWINFKIHLSCNWVTKGRGQANPETPTFAVMYSLRTETNRWMFRHGALVTGQAYPTNSWVVDTGLQPSNEWHHYVLTYEYGVNATNEPTFYQDGVPLAGSWHSGDGAAICLTNDQYLQFAGTLYFNDAPNGFINEIGIWNTILTQKDVTILYSTRVKRTPLQIRPSNLIIYLPLDEQKDYETSLNALSTFNRTGDNRIVGGHDIIATRQALSERKFSYSPNE